MIVFVPPPSTQHLNTVFLTVPIVWVSWIPLEIVYWPPFHPLPGITFFATPFASYPEGLGLKFVEVCQTKNEFHFLLIVHRGKENLKLKRSSEG